MVNMVKGTEVPFEAQGNAHYGQEAGAIDHPAFMAFVECEY